jgi:hypothetical protein
VRAAGLVTADAFGAVNRFGYFVLYPAFLFLTVTKADLEVATAWPFIVGVISAFAIVGAVTLATLPVSRNGPAFTSVFQGALRWNGFAILAAADSIFGPGARSLIAIIFGPTVLMNNVLSVAVLARWGGESKPSARYILAQIAGNPLVLACLAGLAVRITGLHDFGVIDDTLELLGDAAMPVALVCVGAGLDLGAARAARREVALATALKLAAAPIIFYGVVLLLGGDARSAAIACAIGATPTAAASYTLAREMGGDARLMAAIVSVTTLISFATMPLAITLALGFAP